jgi:beta-glucosidase-like glycosyl hydrolase
VAVNIILGPSMGPLGRIPAGGRNWEGFGPDPYLQGVAASETIGGIQSEGVIATAKHFILKYDMTLGMTTMPRF